MSKSKSPSTLRVYGLARVCSAWRVSRSSMYHHRAVASQASPLASKGRRGPKPSITDDELLTLILHEIERSPFQGEGYRKIYARILVDYRVTVARKRVLRVMRENNLLSPFRVRQGKPLEHKGTITTDAPNQMWGTDGTLVLTANEGLVWIFAAVEHWNAECVGWHVCKVGDRYAALKPIEMAVANQYEWTGRDAARGLSLRMDHGSQYVSEHFRNQIHFWGIKESYGFIEQPQTNGVAERFFRTLKEQIIHGRIYLGVADLTDAIRQFVDTYNNEWLIQKLGHISPRQARLQTALPMAA